MWLSQPQRVKAKKTVEMCLEFGTFELEAADYLGTLAGNEAGAMERDM